MNEPENFLERWSRRKRVAGETPEPTAPGQPAQPDDAAPDEPADQHSDPGADASSETKAEKKQVAAHPPAAKNAPEPVFDPASLPSIESIGAQTDISGFLKPGVPGELKLAALRRAWTVDPAIRDFVGLQDYDWDFTVPGSMPGFGELDPGFDVKKMLGEIFNERTRVAEPGTETPAQMTQPESQQQLAQTSDELSKPADQAALNPPAPPESVSADRAAREKSDDENEMVQREENIATQDKSERADNVPVKRRRSQGGALPQ